MIHSSKKVRFIRDPLEFLFPGLRSEGIKKSPFSCYPGENRGPVPPSAGLKKRTISLILFIVFSLAWITAFLGVDPVKVLYSQLSGALSLSKSLNEVSIWPNVYFTVEELGKIKFNNLTKMIGDQYLLFFSVFCLLVSWSDQLLKAKLIALPVAAVLVWAG